MMKNINLKPLPEIGKEYHFWDDGKISPTRHYICRIENIIKPQDAKKIILKRPSPEFTQDNRVYEKISLLDIWKEEVYNHDWIFSPETDYFVEASCPVYDDNNLWFARTKDGGWFSMDVQSFWQSGRLDVTGEIFEDVINEWTEWGGDISHYLETTYDKK